MKHKKFRIGRWIAGALSGILLFSCVQARRVEDESEISSREYAISAFIEAAGIQGLEDSSVLSAYSDADQVSPACQPYLAAAVEEGLVRGFEDHTLRPQTPIRRIEAFIILAHCLGDVDEVARPVTYTDVPAWAAREINRLSRGGLVQGYENGSLGAQDNMTVAQVEDLTERVGNLITLSRLTAANQYDALMERHSSVRMSVVSTSSSGEEDRSFYYVSDSLAVFESEDREQQLIEDGIVLDREPEFDSSLVATLYTLNNNYEAARSFYEQQISVDDYGQMPQYVRRMDGNILIAAEQRDPESLVREAVESFGYPYETGTAIVTTYTYAEETGDLLEANVAVRFPNGTERNLRQYVYEYDESYDKDSSPFAEYYASRQMRNLTVTYAPGTEFEENHTYRLPKMLVRIISDKGEAEAMYVDPELTQEFTGSAPEDYSDLDLYLKPLLEPAQEEDEENFLALVERNSVTQVFDRHNRERVSIQYLAGEETAFQYDYYADKNTLAYEESGGFGKILRDGHYVQTNPEDMEKMVEYLFAGTWAYQEREAQEREALSMNADGEELIYAGEAEDYYVYVTRNYSQELIDTYLEETGIELERAEAGANEGFETEAAVIEEAEAESVVDEEAEAEAVVNEEVEAEAVVSEEVEAEENGETAAEADVSEEVEVQEESGLSFLSVYTFDKETGDLVQTECYLELGNGEQRLAVLESHEYDGESYDLMSSPFAYYYAQKEIRQIRVTFAADTDHASTMWYMVPGDTPALVIYKGMFPVTYSNAACTVPFQGYQSGRNSVIYIRESGE